MASDLSSKYQKLSQEYQKARAQVAVLKKAVLDEQSTNRTFQDTIKQKDQSIRRYEQEIDSLQFRNDQLSKRVEILQGELDEMERKGTKVKGATEYRSAEGVSDSVKDEELLMKIKENEMLHQKLSEATQQHHVVVQKLEDRLSFLEKERENHEKVVEEANSRYSRVIERLQEDRTFMEGKAKKQEEDLKIANIMVDKYQQQLKGVHKDLKDKLEKATILLRQKLPFNDTEYKQWNILNVPVCDRSYQTHARNLVSDFSGALTTFVSGLCDFLSHIEQWILFHASDVKREEPTPLSVKLTGHLHGNASVIQEVTTALSKFSEFAQKEFLLSLETCAPLQDVSKAFTKLTQYLRKILPYFLICMTEETEFPDCPEQLENLTKDFSTSFAKMVGNIQRLDRYLALISTFAENPSLKNTSGTCFKHMHSHLKKLSASCEDLCTFYYLKSEEEQKLPTMSERLINADKCILKALTSLSSTAMKMLNFFDANVDFISRGSGFKRKGFAADEEQGLTSAVKHFQAKARTYMEGLHKDTEESIPHAVAVHNYRTLVTSTESRETLAQQVLNSQETLSKLEQEKEHWMLEAQLIKVKYEKEMKRVAILGEELKKARSDAEQRFSGVQVEDLEENLEKPVGSGTTPRSPSIASVSSGQESLIAFPQVGTVEVVSNEKEKTTEDAHETMMKDHLTARISGLTRQAQQADSKAVSFYAECRALYKQLVLADKSKKRIENELTQAHKGIEELQDVLETTKRSYEEQLRTLSDHLCGMNEQLTSQREKAEASKTPTKGRVGVGLGRKKEK